jgi:integrase
MTDYLSRRGPFWHFQRWVPAEFRAVDARRIVEQSTKVRVADDPDKRRARRIADSINGALEALWRDLAGGKAAGARQRYRQTILRARRLGFEYRDMGEMIERRATLELVKRIEALEARGILTDAPSLDAVLGGVPQPKLMCSEMFDEYAKLRASNNKGMSDEQRKKWKLAHTKPLADFLSTIAGGDKPFADLARTDATAFFRWWSARIEEENYNRNTANVEISRLATMVRRIARHHDIPVAAHFADLRFDSQESARLPIDTAMLRKRYVAPGTFDGLEPELRRILFVMIETGLSPSEAVGLTSDRIHLAGKVPHIVLDPPDRRLKTKNRKREIPLVGIALKALQAQPDGFPTWRDNRVEVSRQLNTYLRAKGLLPTENHTLYSVRHAFKDRLLAIEAPEQMVDSMMGHTRKKPKYGKGYDLAMRAKWLQRIALPVPSKLSV